jgi:hypothetical protein
LALRLRSETPRRRTHRGVRRFEGQNDMSVQLNQADREHLELLANREMRPTNRQMAQALLGLAEGTRN